MKILKGTAFILMLITVFAFTACDDSGSGDSTVVVSVTGIILNKSTTDIRISQTEQLTATITPSDATNQEVRWMSTDETVATVSETGVVTMNAIGTAKIIASSKDGGFTATCTVSVLYALRDTGPAGGFIFYDKGSYSEGWRYLEAAPSDQSTGVYWANETGFDARSICAELIIGDYSDWFLPSKDELNKMYINLKSGTDENSITYTPVGGFADDHYWSSTEYDAFNAWSQYFPNGNQLDYFKNLTISVRAARAF